MDRTRHMQAQASDAAQLPVDEDDGEGEDGGLLIAGSHHSPRRSQLLTSAIMADEDDVSQPAESQRSPEQVAKEGLQVLRHVSELTDFNVDAFFLDPLRPVKVRFSPCLSHVRVQSQRVTLKGGNSCPVLSCPLLSYPVFVWVCWKPNASSMCD